MRPTKYSCFLATILNKIMADEEQSTPAEGTELPAETQNGGEKVDPDADEEDPSSRPAPAEEGETEENTNTFGEQESTPQTEPGANTDGEEKVTDAGEPPPEGDSAVAETVEGAPAEEQPSEEKAEGDADTTQTKEGEGTQVGASTGEAGAAEGATGEETAEEEKEGEEAKAQGQDGQPEQGDTEGAAVEGTTQEGEPQGDETQEGEPQSKVADGEEQPVEGDTQPTREGGEPKEDGTEGAEEKPASPIPQSDTFQDGERPETPTVQVPEPLSREGSPTQEPTHLEAGTPEREESPRPEDIIEEDEEEDEEPFYSREELVEAYQTALAEKEQLQNHNTQLQHKLAEYFRKKKSDDQRQEMDKNVTDQEQRYLKYMSNLEDLRNQEAEERENFYLHLEELKEKKQDKLELVEAEDKAFTELKRRVASDAISSRTGKPLMPREVEMYITNELKKEEEVKAVRLENIKLKNRLKKREQQLKAKEELAEGLHLIDFEQLKIENQTYNEKIEERNEELLKLRKKITSTVQVLTHVKEKLQFVQAENQVQKSALREVEALVAQKRDLLSRTKKARDSLRIDNQRLRQKSGLLGNKALLRDFEERKDEGDELRAKLERLKRMHAELVLKSAGVKKKIEDTRATRS